MAQEPRGRVSELEAALSGSQKKAPSFSAGLLPNPVGTCNLSTLINDQGKGNVEQANPY